MEADLEARIGVETSKEPLFLDDILVGANDEADLLKQVSQIDGDHVERVAVLSFRALQLIRIAQLQAALIKEQNAMVNSGYRHTKPRPNKPNETPRDEPEDGARIDALIQRYSDAVRNYETLAQSVTFDKNTKYEFLGGAQLFQIVKRENTARWIPHSQSEATVPLYRVGPLGFRELDKKRLNKRQWTKRFHQRLRMAIFGGIAILVPVIIMSFRTKLSEQLIITSVATVLFAIWSVIIGTDASGKDVLASTAAYAAVLVVFVGTTLQASS
ncbi:hypothetical protein F5Y16DRAFT_402604 [Xylariaceae sp. FL0255]|nr:hypothetical protein F5Y16DRAFT_402604 [Xylariaceae sp. FL0255]